MIQYAHSTKLRSISKMYYSHGYCANSRGYNNHHVARYITSRSDRYLFEETQAVPISKKRKANDAKAMVVSDRVGTRTQHFLAYISNVMDVWNCRFRV
jgi:hypothetical protein